MKEDGHYTQKDHQEEDREAGQNLVPVKSTGNLVLLEPGQKGQAGDSP
jgi:hypothetical protein